MNDPSGVLAWPAERFYWSILEAPGLTRPGLVPPGLLPALEEDLPEPIESLHAVCTPLGGGRALACAALKSEVRAIDPATLRLCPQSLPSFIAVGRSIPSLHDSLNLLVGEFEPRPVRAERARRQLTAIAATLLCAGLLITGTIRRTHAWQDQAAQAREAQAALLHSVGVLSPQALSEQLVNARRESAGRVQPPADAAAALASILSSWPAVSSKPVSLSVAEQTAGLSVNVEGDATPFLRAFRSPPGWTLDEPRVNTAGPITRLSLVLRKEGVK